ncbi:Zinc/iron permease [Pisolithus microcarpus]|nr:Zinc/iron permease [Pisolithus microcarpus]
MWSLSPSTSQLPALLTLSDTTEATRELRTNSLTILAIFLVSLCAASFPALSKRVSFLRIPRVVFFIGKHFGTGVILSTAFTHLLQDAFEALRDPIVLAKWNIGKYTGLIVLGSLLSIFLIEYTSTAYVDQLQSYSSPTVTRGSTPCTRSPPPDDEVTSGRLQTPVKLINDVQNHDRERQPLLNARSDVQCYDNSHEHEHDVLANHTSALTAHLDTSMGSAKQNETRTDLQNSSHPRRYQYSHSHLQHQSGSSHLGTATSQAGSNPHATHRHGDVLPTSSVGTYAAQHARQLDEVTQDVPTIIEGHHRHEPRTAHSVHHERVPRLPYIYGPGEFGQGMTLADGGIHDHDVEHLHDDDDDGNAGHEPRIGKKRQVVGILVLQLGIMIHSLVIGLTLAIKTGSDFASLLVAVIFHQFFEGLSLGIRIASLPSSSSSSATTARIPPVSVPESNSSSFEALPSTDGRVHGRSMSPTLRNVDVEFGLTAHPRTTENKKWDFMDVLKPTLACSFAVTTPIGIGLGMIVFGVGGSSAHMRLVQGLMSGISAGMLIYAACVEMLAADFVMDPTLWRSGWKRQFVAVGSLLMGAIGMGVVP